MILPKLTKTQLTILFFLYKFRFLNTNQIQQLLGYKQPQYAQELLKDLKDKGYIKTNYNPKSYIENTQPAIYYLAAKARHELKKNKNCHLTVLDRIYNEKKRTEEFINQCMAIADIYMFFIKHKKPDERVSFFTETELKRFEYFPEPPPTAYIAVKTKEKTRRYFLELFKDRATSGNIRFRFREYLTYVESGEWEANANGAKFPSVLFILPTERKRKHIGYYAKALFAKAFEEKFPLYVTSKNTIRFSKNNNIWGKVEL